MQTWSKAAVVCALALQGAQLLVECDDPLFAVPFEWGAVGGNGVCRDPIPDELPFAPAHLGVDVKVACEFLGEWNMMAAPMPDKPKQQFAIQLRFENWIVESEARYRWK